MEKKLLIIFLKEIFAKNSKKLLEKKFPKQFWEQIKKTFLEKCFSKIFFEKHLKKNIGKNFFQKCFQKNFQQFFSKFFFKLWKQNFGNFFHFLENKNSTKIFGKKMFLEKNVSKQFFGK